MKKLVLLALLCIVPAIAFARSPEGSVNNQKTIDKLNSLLRGEISAVETYRKAIDKVANEPGAAKLVTYKEDHQSAADSLSQEIRSMGGTPSTDSGAWGTWASTVQNTANLFGDTSALTALKNGEQHGLDEYKEAVADAQIPTGVKDTIREKFMKNQQAHIEGLNQFIAQVKNS